MSLHPLPGMLAALFLLAGPSLAAEPDTIVLEEVVVVAVSPTEGTERPRDDIARHVQKLTAERLARAQSLDLSDYLNRHLASVSINAAQNNPLQPDLQFRGYTASPLLGLPQGLAVYQDGARLNEPLGDAVNWDLIPASAIHEVTLVGGADPLFGQNSLGGALALVMKDGFNFSSHQAELSAGSHDRRTWGVESGANDGTLGYYANVSRLEEDGWRDLSPSRADTARLALSWRGETASVDLAGNWGESRLTGNGAAPVGLLERDRRAIFTAPDITENEARLFTLEGSHVAAGAVRLSGSAFIRYNDTASLNGDASEYSLCRLGNGERLLEGFEEDDVENLGLAVKDLCDTDRFADTAALERFLNQAAGVAAFDVEDVTGELTGSGGLSGEAINNRSTRDQKSHGFDVAGELRGQLLGLDHTLATGVRQYRGEARFQASVELAGLDPVSRSTRGLGFGTFIESEATSVFTTTETWSLYAHDLVTVTDVVTVTLAGRFDATNVTIEDKSGRHPEVEGDHDFRRFNPALGITWQVRDTLNLYAGYSQSSRAPTPIELTCNEAVFERAATRAAELGEDPASVNFECRLPNAFVADPPLDEVVTRSVELGARGGNGTLSWHAGLFQHVNRDDIVFQTTGRARGLFATIDRTRRRGVELTAGGAWRELDWLVAYTWLAATFQDGFSVQSPSHPDADDDGRIVVTEGSRIPGIPDHQLKLSADWQRGALSLGAGMVYFSGTHLRGDEANALAKTDGYTVLDLRAGYRVNRHLEIFARLDNALGADYETFGLIAEDPGEVIAELVDRRPLFLSPGPPRAGWIGVRLQL